jgi:hypothetical protein
VLQTPFGSLKTNFSGCGRDDRIIVWGTTATSDELTGNFGSALEDTSIGDYRLVALFAEKSLKAIFGVLQHYPSRADIVSLIAQVRNLPNPDITPVVRAVEAKPHCWFYFELSPVPRTPTTHRWPRSARGDRAAEEVATRASER